MKLRPLFFVAVSCIAALATPVCGADSGADVGSGSSSSGGGDDYLSQADSLYATLPDLAGCRPGILTTGVKQAVVDELNQIRALHGLPPVGYDTGSDAAVSQGALMLAANGELSHTPPASWACYTSTGASGLGSSNIAGGVTSPYLQYESPQDNLVDWLSDTNNLIGGNIGHRRWLLDPFLQSVAYGRAEARTASGGIVSGAALKVINDNGASACTAPEVIAYPVDNYPARYYPAGALFSLSILHDRSSRANNADVDFSAAAISMQERGGAAVAISQVAYDNKYYGLPNNLQFLPGQVTPGKTYDITVSNVVFGGKGHSFSYSVQITP